MCVDEGQAWGSVWGRCVLVWFVCGWGARDEFCLLFALLPWRVVYGVWRGVPCLLKVGGW